MNMISFMSNFKQTADFLLIITKHEVKDYKKVIRQAKEKSMSEDNNEPIEISIVDHTIDLSLPRQLEKSFTVTNLTIRPIVVYIILSHEDELFVSLNHKIKILQAFQQIEVRVGLKAVPSSLRIPAGFSIPHGSMRVYYWEIKPNDQISQQILQQDELILLSPKKRPQPKQKGSTTQESNYSSQHNQNQCIEDSRQFAEIIKRKRVRQQLQNKYKESMFNIKNISNNKDPQSQHFPEKIAQKHQTSKKQMNKQLNKPQHHFQSSQQQEQYHFSPLFYKDYSIRVSLDKSLECSLFKSVSKHNHPNQKSVSQQQNPSSRLINTNQKQKIVYILQNIIRPNKAQFPNQKQKQKQVQLIQKQIFSHCQKFGTVKAIDRLNRQPQLNQDRTHNNPHKISQSHHEIQVESNQSLNSTQINISRNHINASNRSINVKKVTVTNLQLYAIEYKAFPKFSSYKQLKQSQKELQASPSEEVTLKDDGKSQYPLTCEFIEVITKKYFYLYKLIKIFPNDYLYSQLTSKNNRKLPTLIDTALVSDKLFTKLKENRSHLLKRQQQTIQNQAGLTLTANLKINRIQLEKNVSTNTNNSGNRSDLIRSSLQILQSNSFSLQQKLNSKKESSQPAGLNSKDIIHPQPQKLQGQIKFQLKQHPIESVKVNRQLQIQSDSVKQDNSKKQFSQEGLLYQLQQNPAECKQTKEQEISSISGPKQSHQLDQSIFLLKKCIQNDSKECQFMNNEQDHISSSKIMQERIQTGEIISETPSDIKQQQITTDNQSKKTDDVIMPVNISQKEQQPQLKQKQKQDLAQISFQKSQTVGNQIKCNKEDQNQVSFQNEQSTQHHNISPKINPQSIKIQNASQNTNIKKDHQKQDFKQINVQEKSQDQNQNGRHMHKRSFDQLQNSKNQQPSFDHNIPQTIKGQTTKNKHHVSLPQPHNTKVVQNPNHYSTLVSQNLQFNRQGHHFDDQYTSLNSLKKLSLLQQDQQLNTTQFKQQLEELRDVVPEPMQLKPSTAYQKATQVHRQGNDIEGSLKVTQTTQEKSLSPSKRKNPTLSLSFSHTISPIQSIEKPPSYTQQFIVYPDPILSIHIFQNTEPKQDKLLTERINHLKSHLPSGPIVFLLFRTHLLYFPISNPELKISIKIDPLKVDDTINYKTIMCSYKSQQIICANGCYIYWIDLKTKSSQWKYVQRKEIYAIQPLDEMGLLAVGGKNFSKLSLFGKETSRSNIKIYNCGKPHQRNHLFTYDIPINQPVGNVLDLKYITTPPSNGKLLMCYTNYNDQVYRLLFFRVKAYNTIEMYGKFELNQIGIQSILKIKYNPKTLKLLVLQQVSQDHSSLKRLKVKSMYQKAQVLTEGIKMEFGQYEDLEIGGQKQVQWYSLVSKGKQSAQIYRSYRFHNNPQTIKLQKHDIDAVFDLQEGTQVLIKGYDFIKIRRKKKIVQQTFK